MATANLADVRANSTAVANKPKSNVATFADFLNKNRSQIEAALPKHMTSERMIRLAMTAYSSSAQLQKCDQLSIYKAVMLAAQVGLEIGVQGQAYIIPYGTTATFVPGWQGLVDLVARAGRSTVWTGAVFEGDKFSFRLGARPDLEHEPGGENDPAKLLYTYAIGWVKGAEWPVIEVWRAERLRKHRDRMNKVGQKHYSYAHWEMYGRKIPLLQVLKYMPKSVELSTALESDHDGMTFEGEFTVVDGAEAPINSSVLDAGESQGNQGGAAEMDESSSGKPEVVQSQADAGKPAAAKKAAQTSMGLE